MTVSIGIARAISLPSADFRAAFLTLVQVDLLELW